MKLSTHLTMLLAGAALLVAGVTARGASVVGSKHDLNTLAGVSMPDKQVCLPCHAPHNMPPANYGLSRLWNHTMPANTYTLFDGSTSVSTWNGTGTAPKYVGLDDVSRKCLSCHDGTVAVDSYGGATDGTAWAYSSSGTTFMPAGYQIGGGQNLTHDHPVGLQYPGLSTDGKTFTPGGYDKNPLLFSKTARPVTLDTATTTSGTTNYLDTDGNPITGVGKIGFGKLTVGGVSFANIVGCGSCHTPHDNTYRFLVVQNTGSQLCLSCHNK